MIIVGMFPYKLVMSLDSDEISLLTPYEYYAIIHMSWLLLDCYN